MALHGSANNLSVGLIVSVAVILQDFGRAWLGYALTAALAAGIAHGVFHIPLWQVVDVTMSLFLFFVAVFACLTVIAAALDVGGGEFVTVIARVLSLVLLLLLPLGTISGFAGYSFVSGTDFESSSFVYGGYVALLARAYLLVGEFAGDIFGVAKVGVLHVGPASLDMPSLLFTLQFASLVVALFGLAMKRSRVAFTVDDTLSSKLFPKWRTGLGILSATREN